MKLELARTAPLFKKRNKYIDRKVARIHLITGGQRSGKSSYAMNLAEELTDKPVYLATAREWDDNFKKRIDYHKSNRPDNWNCLEIEKKISEADIENRVVVFDCVTLWLTNIFTEMKYDLDRSMEFARLEWESFIKKNTTVFVVTNEIGMGVHASKSKGRIFVDLQGFMNQYIAGKASDVTLMISGIPIKIK